ncbi:MAG TPA: class I SAM-dependent methyltransferase [Puia sp.]
MSDALGAALTDYYNNKSTGKLWVHNNYGPKEEMPVDHYFREMEEMPELEWVALQQCRGRILDIGAGAGSHALALQKMGQDVTALDISPKAAEVMRARGVKNVLEGNIFGLTAPGQPYDTLLLLMNGIGLSGTISGLRRFLAKARTLLQPGGQLVFDSSDIAYLYEETPPPSAQYYGELQHMYEYKKQRSDWFEWLFIDRKTLSSIAQEEGWKIELLYEDPWDQFLVRCRPA